MAKVNKAQAREFAKEALQLVDNDGEWPAAAYEDAAHARRAAALQDAIRKLAFAVQELAE